MEKTVIIIGAGVSGLVAAIELEKHGINPVILESGSSVGGRVKTTVKNGYYLDHGFQVLLTAYPEASRYLDYDALNLRYFDPGAIILRENQSYTLSDPRRDWKSAFPMLFSGIGTFSDKLKILRLASHLGSSSIAEIFDQKSVSTMEFLKSRGFSDQIIENFFRPFFAGIFLEDKLETSSRMFQFVFKMFAAGSAAIPAEGMQAIPEQLHGKLKNTRIKFNVCIDRIEQGKVFMGEDAFEYDDLIIATHPAKLLQGFRHENVSFRDVYTFYFDTDSSSINKPLIALLPDKSRLVNNFCFMTDVYQGFAPSGRALLSATVVGPVENDALLEERVKMEMGEITGKILKPVGAFSIREALPVIPDIQHAVQPSSTRIQDHIYLAGDHLLNPSLNAAMASGRTAAEAVISSYY